MVASCFIAVEAATQAIACYHTLAATSVPANDLPSINPGWPVEGVARCRLRSGHHHRPTNTGCGATLPNGLAEGAPALVGIDHGLVFAVLFRGAGRTDDCRCVWPPLRKTASY